MTRQLSVWLFGTHVGTLSQIDGRLNFSYLSDWLNAGNSIPLAGMILIGRTLPRMFV
jgi:HipA-like protein